MRCAFPSTFHPSVLSKMMSVQGRAAMGLLLVTIGSTACDRSASSIPDATLPPEGVLALVNGVPITRADLAAKARIRAHRELTPKQQQNLLRPIITDELLAQEAEKLGLDAEPQYQAELQRLQAEVDIFRRRRLKSLLFRHQLKAIAEVTDAEVKAYFDANAKRLRAELHVHQILRTDMAALQAIRKTVVGGTSFYDVLKEQTKRRQGDARPPWDLGYLKWSQVPESWHGVVDKLKPGELSPIIKGPGKRFWLVRLVDRRINPNVTFESERARIKAILRDRRMREKQRDLTAELRKTAQIEIIPISPQAPAR